MHGRSLSLYVSVVERQPTPLVMNARWLRQIPRLDNTISIRHNHSGYQERKPFYAEWTALDVAKMLVAALTPLTVLLGGFLLDRRLTLLQQEQWGRQKVIERRIKAYDELAPQLNELYCYFCYVGTWKKLDPPQVVEMKRQLDRNAYISAPLFDESFLPKYNLLLEKCFATFGSWPDDAKLRVFSDRRVLAAGTAWQTQWNRCFTSPSEFVDPHQVQAAYVQVMHYLAHAIGIHEVSSQQLGSTPIHSLEETDSPRDLQKGIVSDIGQAGSASTITPYHGPEAVT